MAQAPVTPETSLLLTLEEISQLVSHSHHPGETLANIVSLIQSRFRTDVCSVYLHEPDLGELVLGATIGLKPESVGTIRMRLEEGLTGLVAEKMRPVMVEDAFSHPRFKFFPEAGEDPYHSFLGVPLVEGGMLQGVLVVQTREPRQFSANEIRMLVAVGAQLAPLVSEARLLEEVVAVAHQGTQESSGLEASEAERLFQGLGLSPGVGWGQAYLVNGFQEWQEAAHDRPCEFAIEEERLNRALDAAREEISRLGQRISEVVGEDHGAILQGQLMILQDDHITEDLRERLRRGQCAEAAILDTLQKYVEAFQKLSSPVFQDRVYDIKDVFRRILWHLLPQAPGPQAQEGRLVLVAHDASVMDLFSVDFDRLAGVVIESGGAQSHAAILARSLGIPMVGQIPDLVKRVAPGRTLRVDGTAGLVELNPSLEHRPPAEPAKHDFASSAVPPILDVGLPQLEANINLLCEASQAIAAGTKGVGLYRSEFLFLARRTLPTEEEQVGIYRKLLALLEGRPVSIRTFDLRPDKLANYASLSSFFAHPLDWRLVLSSPPMQKLFKDQVRAIMRAATTGPARILVPLVTRTEQFDFILETVQEARDELRREGIEYIPNVPVGIMLEVAAATALVDSWARYVDFFAVGTNDLVASILGIDREHPVGASSQDGLHPGLLRILSDVVAAAHAAGRSVSVCGEIAGEPECALALAALQVDFLSMAVQKLPAMAAVFSRQSSRELASLKPELLALRTSAQAWEFLHTRLTQAELEPASVA